MRRSLDKINESYRSSPTDPWGVDWRGTMVIRNRFYVQAVREALKALPASRDALHVLDVGCGSGILSEQLYAAIAEQCPALSYVAVDVSEAAIAQARRLRPASVIQFRTVSEDLHELQGQRFDLIVGFEFLPYLAAAERHGVYERLRQLCRLASVVVLSSNVRRGDSGEVYLGADELTSEMQAAFQAVDSRDLYLSPYIDGVERRLLAFCHRRLVGGVVRRTLSWPLLPSAVQWLVRSVATRGWPKRRNRVFILR